VSRIGAAPAAALAAVALAFAFAAVLSLAAGGCAKPVGENSTRGPTKRQEVPAVIGDWTVVGHRIPGTSAMSDGDAKGWYGRVFHYAEGRAWSVADTCAHPAYRRRIVRADSLLGDGFHTTLEKLAWPDTTNQMLAITEVTCGGEAWSAPGGLLIWVAPDKPYTTWDGVFFELQRDSTVRDSTVR
jgi:hypothetical protein